MALSLLFLVIVNLLSLVFIHCHSKAKQCNISSVNFCCIAVSGHTHQELKLDCAFTPSDAHVISGSEDGKDLPCS